jgi:CRP-like cAMP-binding protein
MQIEPITPFRSWRVADARMLPLAKRLSAFATLEDRDLAAIASLHTCISHVPRGTNFVVEDDASDRIHILCDGWAARYRIVADGKRQILNFAIPGDLIGVLLNALTTARHSVCAVTDLRVASVPTSQLEAIAHHNPVLRRAIQWVSACEWAMLCEHLVSVGRRSATARIAHLLLELQARLTLVDRASGASFSLPITQEMIADCLGLTHVHVSRSLRKLNERGLVRYERNRVVIVDSERLAFESDFSDSYLDHRHRPSPLTSRRKHRHPA